MNFTPEQILQMAREAGATTYTNRHYLDRPYNTFNPEQLERFATLVADAAIKSAPDYKMGYADGAAAEREACAKVCESEASIEGIAQRCATAIRARGQG